MVDNGIVIQSSTRPNESNDVSIIYFNCCAHGVMILCIISLQRTALKRYLCSSIQKMKDHELME